MIIARSISNEESNVLLALTALVFWLVQTHMKKERKMPVLKNRKQRNQRSLGRNQQASPPQASVVQTSTGTTNVTLTFSLPVVVNGTIPNTVATLTLVSQTIVSPTVVTQVWNGNVATHLGTFPSNPAQVRTQLGGGVSGNAVTF